MKHLLTAALIATVFASPLRGEETLQEQIDDLRSELQTVREAIITLHNDASSTPSAQLIQDALEFTVDAAAEAASLALFESDDAQDSGTDAPVLLLNDWSITETDNPDYFNVSATLESATDKEVVMMHVLLELTDRLGTPIDSVFLPIDTTIPPLEIVTVTRRTSSWRLTRAVELNPDYVVVTLNIDNLLFSDGTTLMED